MKTLLIFLFMCSTVYADLSNGLYYSGEWKVLSNSTIPSSVWYSSSATSTIAVASTAETLVSPGVYKYSFNAWTHEDVILHASPVVTSTTISNFVKIDGILTDNTQDYYIRTAYAKSTIAKASPEYMSFTYLGTTAGAPVLQEFGYKIKGTWIRNVMAIDVIASFVDPSKIISTNIFDTSYTTIEEAMAAKGWDSDDIDIKSHYDSRWD